MRLNQAWEVPGRNFRGEEPANQKTSGWKRFSSEELEIHVVKKRLMGKRSCSAEQRPAG
jgi:hypothetical protein